MAAIYRDERFEEAVEAAVGEAERATDAEIVVVAAGRSGSYRDLAISGGFAASLALVLVAVFSPWSFDERWLAADMLLVTLGVTWVLQRWPAALRLLSGASRRRAQVLEAAAATFHREQVHATRGRTGLLIYLSALEDQVAVIPDHGVAARVPQAVWNDLRWDARHLDGFLDGLPTCGEVLAEALPAREGDNPDEIPNKPRVRP